MDVLTDYLGFSWKIVYQNRNHIHFDIKICTEMSTVQGKNFRRQIVNKNCNIQKSSQATKALWTPSQKQTILQINKI